MSQFRVGKASVAQGAQIVTFTGASLLDEQMVVSNNLFSFQGENVWYQIVNVAVLNGNLDSVTLATPYAGASKTDQSFAIHRDFSTNLNLPIAGYGDINVAPLYQQSMTVLDSALGALGAYAGPLTGVNSSTWTLRKGIVSELAEDAGLLIHREGQSALSLVFTGSQPWKRWSVGSQDLEVGGRLAVGREPVANEKAVIAGNATVDGDLTVMGQLYVRGDTLILDVSNVEVEDPIISVGRGNTGAAPFLGIKAERGASDVFWTFDEATDRWCAYLSGDDLTTKSFGNVQAATFYGALSGNASTATKLATSRNIVASGDVSGSAAFDGSANAALALTLADTGVGAGTYTKIVVDSKGRVVAGTSITALDIATVLGYTPVQPSDATPANVPEKIVKRDASGNFSANEITGTIIKATQFQGDLLGTAQSAGKLLTARAIALSGDATGSVVFDGTGNVTIATTLADTGVTAGTYSNLIIDAKGRVTAARALAPVDITGALGYTPLDSAGGTVNGDVIVTGDLTVQGTLTQVNTTEISIDDPILTVAKGNATAILPFAGVKVERGTDDAFFVWDETNDRWTAYTSSNDLSTRTLATIAAASFLGALTGNASTATKLATARTINGVSFDGSANISFSTSNVSEGSNQYFTTARARSAITVTPGGSLAYDPVTGILTSTISEGTGPVWTVAGKDGHVTLEIADIEGLSTALAGKLDTGSALFTGTATVRGSTSFGYLAMNSGNATNPGFVSFHTADEIRRGYIGAKKSSGNALLLQAENGWTWQVAGGWDFDTTPTAPTPDSADNSTKIATTAHVKAAIIAAGLASATHGHVIGDITNLQAALDAKAPLSSPALTGAPTAPTPPTADNSTKIATTAHVQANASLLMPKTGGVFTGPIWTPALTLSPSATTGLTIGARDDFASFLTYVSANSFRWQRSGFVGKPNQDVASLSVDGVFDALGLRENGNAVWHAGNFDPSAKLSLTGGIMTGNISFRDFGEGVVLAGGGKIYDQATGGTAGQGRSLIVANNDSFEVLNEAGTASLFTARLADEAPTFKGDKLFHSGSLFPARGMRGPSAIPNNYTFVAADDGEAKHMNLGGGVQVANLPAVSDISDGWSCVITTEGLPSGYQTARVTSPDRSISFRNAAFQNFYLIGKGEAFRFTWMTGLNVWFAECIRQPGEVSIRRHWSGTGGWNTNSTAFTPIFFNNNAYDYAVFGLNANYTNLPVAGVYRHYYRYQPGANAGGGVSGSASIASGNDAGAVMTDYAYAYINMVAGEDSQFMVAEWSRPSQQGSVSAAFRQASSTSIWYYPDNNFGIITLLSR